MSNRSFARMSLAFAIVAVTALTVDATRAPVQASRVTFTEVTRVCGYFLMGTYVVVHDDAKMAAGEPCTTFYKLSPGKAAEPAVSFHCIPRARRPVATTTFTTAPARMTNVQGMPELIEYQIAGDSEAHGVPRFGEPNSW